MLLLGVKSGVCYHLYETVASAVECVAVCNHLFRGGGGGGTFLLIS